MSKIFTYLFFASCLFTISCEEEIFFEDQNFTPKIVLNSIFTNDSIWLISLTHTTSALKPSTADNIIKDAIIAITDKTGGQVCKLYFNSKTGYYQSSGCTCGYEEEYKIAVYSPTYGAVQATSKVPLKTKIENLKISVSTEDENAQEVQFKIKDNSPDKNFYIWSVVDVDTSRNLIVNDESQKLDFSSLVKELRKEVATVSSGKFSNIVITTDVEVESANQVTKLVTKKFRTETDDPILNEKNVVPMLKLMTVSADLFEYYKSLGNYLKYNQTNSSITEPQKVFSNVKDGYGIFAGYSIQYIPMPK